jgi:hypothetical protein
MGDDLATVGIKHQMQSLKATAGFGACLSASDWPAPYIFNPVLSTRI